jgi:hypothetical protein
MSFLTGGLASIMAAFEPPQGISDASLAAATSTEADAARLLGSKEQQQQQWVAAGEAGKLAAAADEGEVTVDVLIGCVLATVDELPVWESTDIEQVGALGRHGMCERWSSLSHHNTIRLPALSGRCLRQLPPVAALLSMPWLDVWNPSCRMLCLRWGWSRNCRCSAGL